VKWAVPFVTIVARWQKATASEGGRYNSEDAPGLKPSHYKNHHE
jgi:hypothetical protein